MLYESHAQIKKCADMKHRNVLLGHIEYNFVSIITFYSDIDDGVDSLKLFSTELIVVSVVRCIKFINNDVDLPNTLPGGMSARFRMGTSLATYIQVF